MSEKKSLWYRYGEIITFVALIISAMLVLSLVIWSGLYTEKITVEETHDVWDAQAPYGYYWTDVSGEGGGFFLAWHFEFQSSLQESYIIKYIDNEELKTLIIPSSSVIIQDITSNGAYTFETTITPHIILVDVMQEPTLKVITVYQLMNTGYANGGEPVTVDYYITLPDPKVFT